MAGSYTRRINLYINGKEVKNNIASIRTEMNKLINEQSRMTRGTNEYVEAGKKIRVLKGIIQEHNEQLKTVSKSLSFENLSHAMNKYFLAISTFVAGFSGLLYSGKKAISMFAEFDDKVSDVRKTTDLSKESVYAMNNELKKLDTRTAQLELLDLGRIAGKLGIKAEKDVEGFIRASDKVVVALKEDLGGEAEEAVRQVGKLVSVFGIRDEFGIEEAITKTGSAINELGMASTANEGYIVNFAKRVAGVAPSARISLQNVMGLAATLDHLGQTSEVSSTAYSQVITGMFKDTASYAKAARMSVDDFSKLLKTDSNEAFLKLLEGLHNNDAGMEELIKSMGDLDLEGKRAISVIGVLSNNTKLLREQQSLSNREFDKGTSLQQEFNIKNNNAQAILEKKRKELNNMAIDLGQKLMPALTVSTSGFTYFVKSVSVLTDFAIRNSAAIIRLTASIAAYTIATKISTIWQARLTKETMLNTIMVNASNVATGIAKGTTLLYAAAKALLTGNTIRATAAMKLFNHSVKANPIGLLVSMLTLAAGALYTYWQRTKEVVKDGLSLTQETIGIQKEKISQISQEKNELNSLVRQILQTNEKSALRKQLIEDLQKIYPDFLGSLDAEKISNEQLAAQLSIVNQKYGEKIKLAALSARSEALTKKMVDNEGRKLEIEDELASKRKTAVTPGTKLDDNIKALEAEYNSLTLQNKGYEAMLKDLDKKIVKMKEQSFSNTVEWWTKKTNELNFSISATKENIKRANEQNDKTSAEHYAKALASYEAEMKIAELQLAAAEKKAKEEASAGASGNGGGFTPGNGDNNKSKWSLNNDINFLRESLKLKQDYGKGVIKTEEELNTQLRSLEISYLNERIKSGKESGQELLALQQQLAEKYIERRKENVKREDALNEVINKGGTAIESQWQEYEDKLTELGLFGKGVENMTATELAALEALEKEHIQKLSALDAKSMKDEIERRQQKYETEINELQLHHSNELNSITTLEQAKQILSATMSNEELQKVRSLENAKKIIKKQFAVEEQEFARGHMEELLKILQEVMGSGEWEGVDLSDNVLSEEEKQILIERINEVKKLLSGLTAGADDIDPAASKMLGMSTDILGFSQDDWKLLFDNLKDGKVGIEGLIMGAKALGDVWKSYYESVSKYEQGKLEQFEHSVDSQKEVLQNSLDKNLISQEAYNYQVELLDRQLDIKKAELQRKNAIRARNVAIMEAIVNTATAVTSALKIPVAGIALAAIVGAMGALQIGTILATPLPEMPGYEEGGFINVKRAQDGKRFRAKKDPEKRGYVSTPTVITGEQSGKPEYIIPGEGVGNPTIRPVLDILEMGRQNGNLATLNLPAILESTSTYPGRQSGGYISDITTKTAGNNQPPAAVSQNPEMLEIIRQNTIIMAALKSRLDKPIESKVALHGRGGLYETMNEDETLKTNANL